MVSSLVGIHRSASGLHDIWWKGELSDSVCSETALQVNANAVPLERQQQEAK